MNGKFMVWAGAFAFSLGVWLAIIVLVGCAGRITNTVEWGEQLSGGDIEMKISSENKNDVEVVQ